MKEFLLKSFKPSKKKKTSKIEEKKKQPLLPKPIKPATTRVLACMVLSGAIAWLMLDPNWKTDIIGFTLLAALVAYQAMLKKSEPIENSQET